MVLYMVILVFLWTLRDLNTGSKEKYVLLAAVILLLISAGSSLFSVRLEPREKGNYPPSYDQTQGMSNPGYSGADPGSNIPNTDSSVPNSGYSVPNPGYPVQGAYAHTAQGSVYVAGMNTVPMMMSHAMMVGPHPCTITCPQCRTQITTFTRHEAGALAWMSCGLLAIFGCCFGCCLIPFCMESCQDVIHSCPNCQAFIGKYSKLR